VGVVEQAVQALGVLDGLGDDEDPLAVVDGVVEGFGGLLVLASEEFQSQPIAAATALKLV